MIKHNQFKILHEQLALKTGLTPNNVARIRGLFIGSKLNHKEITMFIVKKLQTKQKDLEGLQKNINEYQQMLDFLASGNMATFNEIVLTEIEDIKKEGSAPFPSNGLNNAEPNDRPTHSS